MAKNYEAIIGELTSDESAELFKQLIPYILDERLVAILDQELPVHVKDELAASWIDVDEDEEDEEVDDEADK